MFCFWFLVWFGFGSRKQLCPGLWSMLFSQRGKWSGSASELVLCAVLRDPVICPSPLRQHLLHTPQAISSWQRALGHPCLCLRHTSCLELLSACPCLARLQINDGSGREFWGKGKGGEVEKEIAQTKIFLPRRGI